MTFFPNANLHYFLKLCLSFVFSLNSSCYCQCVYCSKSRFCLVLVHLSKKKKVMKQLKCFFNKNAVKQLLQQ